MIPSPIRQFLSDHAIAVIAFVMMVGLFSIVAFPFLININFGGGGCSVDSRPAVPTLLTVTQDPQTLVVTATLRDESDNEQWFSLQRTLITRNNQAVSVGTNIPVPEGDDLPVSRDTGRTVTIVERGIVEGEPPIPGLEYVYTVRALNCFAESPRSNDISIVALGEGS